MVAFFVSTVFFVLRFTRTTAPVCGFDRETGRPRDRWDDSPHRDNWDTGNCVWKSWDSWSGCSGGSQTRMRLEEDDWNNCRCDIEFQTRSCSLVGKIAHLRLLLPPGPQRFAGRH